MALSTAVTVDWVKQRLGSKGLTVLDARSRSAYVRAHIPGSLHADLFHYLVPGTDATGLARFHVDLSRMFGRLGLDRSKTAVVYESGFGMRAARVAWLLQYAGTAKVYLMKGGFRSWKGAGYRIETKRVQVVPRKFEVRPQPDLLATAGSIKDTSLKNSVIVDVRSMGEYDGTEKRDCCERYGRIRGSVWLEWTEFLDRDGFRKDHALSKSLKELRVTTDREIVTYCHRGARAAVAYYALKSLGFPKVRNYVGSWHEWSSRADLPAETRQARITSAPPSTA